MKKDKKKKRQKEIFILNEPSLIGLFILFAFYLFYAKCPLRLGVIGCGLATKNLHWPALRNLTDKFCIVTVCNHTPNKAREFAQIVGLTKRFQ